MDCLSCSAKLVAHGRTELTNCLAGRNLSSVHRAQRGWEHFFAIIYNFVTWVLSERNNMSAQVAGRPNVTSRLEITLDETHARITLTAAQKRQVCVTHALVPLSICKQHYTRQQTAQSWRVETTRESTLNDCLFAMRISCVCALLKIDSGISRALFIAAKQNVNPFTHGFKHGCVIACIWIRGCKGVTEWRIGWEKCKCNAWTIIHFGLVFIDRMWTTAEKLLLLLYC